MDNANIAETGLAAYFARNGLLPQTVADLAAKAAHELNISLITYLVRMKIIESQAILEFCSKQFGLPVFHLKHYDPTLLNSGLLRPDFILRYRVLPLMRDQTSLSIGLADPTNYSAISAAGLHAGLRIRPMLVSEADLEDVLAHFVRTNGLNLQLESALASITPEEQVQPAAVVESEEPIIKFVDQLMYDAACQRVSDIHIEPFEQHCRIRFRCDGLLYEAASLPIHLAERITTRLKIMANLNIAERRLPQDGRIQLLKTIDKECKVDIRVNICPTLFGEKTVLRLLNSKDTTISIEKLGMTNSQLTLLIEKLKEPQGLILVTGPTGSGKTATLYSMLHYLNQVEKNILSIEDPVEIELKGINQVMVNTKIGLDFATALRTFLRQDPDIIMIGEIRDSETAAIAVQAAQTGHLVLSTLHTNNAIESLNRLQSMGIAPYNLISSLSLIIAQRLIRLLCPLCKVKEEKSYRSKGCKHCQYGFAGRTGIFEVIPITDKIINLALNKIDKNSFTFLAKQTDWLLLQEAGILKVEDGLTTWAELSRVTGQIKADYEYYQS